MIINLIKNVYSKGFFHLLTANYFIGFLGLASQLFVVKFLSPVEMGEIKILQSFIAVFSVLASFGFNTAVLKMCSEDIDRDRKKELLTKNIFYSMISISLIIIIALILVNSGLLSQDEHVRNWLTIYMLFVPATVLTSLFIVYLQALKQIKLMAKVQSTIRLFGVFGIVLSTYYFGFGGFVWSTIIVSYLGLIAIIYLIRDDLKFDISYKLEYKNFNYAKWSVLANLTGTLAMYLDIFILNSLSSDRESLGYYSIATIFLLGLNYITSTVQSITIPYFSEKSNNEKEFIIIYKKYLKLMIMVSVSVGSIAFFLVPLIVNMIYGNAYREVGLFFQILVFKYIFWSSISLVGVAILSLGEIKINFYLTVLSIIISLVITSLFVYKYSIVGAAYGQSIAYFINMLIILILGNMYIKRILIMKENK